MLEFIERQKNRGYLWVKSKAESKQVKWWLAFISFSESIILPLPTAAFVMATYMGGSKKFYHIAFLTTIFSVLGGVFGYFLGLLFFDTIGVRIIEFYHLGKELEEVKLLYNQNVFWVTFTGAFTPIPYKIFVLSAGFLKVNLLSFFVASVIGRGLQFYLIAYIMKHFGDGATRLFLKYFNVIAFFGALLLLYILLF